MTTLRLDPWQETVGKGRGLTKRQLERLQQKEYGGPIWYEDPDKQDLDTDIEHLVLDVVNNTKQLRDLEVSEIITDAEINRTMEGASTFVLTLHDPDQLLLNETALERSIDVKLDGLWFRLVSFEKRGSDLVLTFEDRFISRLRQKTKPLKVSRNRLTRLEFCVWLARTVRDDPVRIVCPELFKKQRFERSTEPKREVKATRRDITAPGLNDADEITVKGVKAKKRQIHVLEWSLDVWEKMGASKRMMLAGIMVLIQESRAGMENVSVSGLHAGPFHQEINRNSFWYKNGGGRKGNSESATRGGARAFLAGCRRILSDPNNRNLSADALAEAVQVAGTPSAWGQWREEAENILDSWGGRIGRRDESGNEQVTRSFRKQFNFSTVEGGERQDYWTAMKRICDDTQFACFMSNGVLYLVSEGQLMKGKIRMVVTPETVWVTNVDFTYDTGQEEASATVTARAARWVAPPGTCVRLRGYGPADGRWLVEAIRRNAYARDAEITIKKATPTLPEPLSEIVTQTVGGRQEEGPTVQGLPAPVSRAYREAKKIHDKKYPYVWGGGHANAGTPDRGTGRDPGIGYDCSGSVAAVLVAGGWWERGASVPRSDALGARFRPGRGKYITIWSNAIHVFMEFHLNGKHDGENTKHFGTGRWGKSWGGAGFNSKLHPKSGFKATHPQGF